MKSIFQAGGSGRLLFWMIMISIPVGGIMAKWFPWAMVPYLIINILVYMYVAGDEEERIKNIKEELKKTGVEADHIHGYEGETYDRFKGWKEVKKEIEDMPQEKES